MEETEIIMPKFCCSATYFSIFLTTALKNIPFI